MVDGENMALQSLVPTCQHYFGHEQEQLIYITWCNSCLNMFSIDINHLEYLGTSKSRKFTSWKCKRLFCKQCSGSWDGTADHVLDLSGNVWPATAAVSLILWTCCWVPFPLCFPSSFGILNFFLARSYSLSFIVCVLSWLPSCIKSSRTACLMLQPCGGDIGVFLLQHVISLLLVQKLEKFQPMWCLSGHLPVWCWSTQKMIHNRLILSTLFPPDRLLWQTSPSGSASDLAPAGWTNQAAAAEKSFCILPKGHRSPSETWNHPLNASQPTMNEEEILPLHCRVYNAL